MFFNFLFISLNFRRTIKNFQIVILLALSRRFPLFGIPRTGTVAYEIGITPFMDDNVSKNGLPPSF
jgi:branched-subunit amino acid permease